MIRHLIIIIVVAACCLVTNFHVHAHVQVDAGSKSAVEASLESAQTASTNSIETSVDESETYSKDEWVVVFNDPRPVRLQDWQASGYSKNGGGYRASLQLKRFGKKQASRYNLDLRDQWFIESLSVYCLVVRFNGDAKRTMAALKKNKRVQWVQPSNEFRLLSSTTSTQLRKPDTTTLEAQSLTANVLDQGGHSTLKVDGAGVIVAIIDSAVDESHRDFAGARNKSVDFVSGVGGVSDTRGESHGTAIAGVMISQSGTELGVVGVSPAITLEAYRGCWENAESTLTRCNTLSLARALDAVVKSEADILNLSLSGPRDDLLDRLIARVLDGGGIVVAAFDPQRSMQARFPTPRDGVLIVRAQGLDVDYSGVFTAPGERVVARPGNQYDYMHGHSVASAYTSGILALRKQVWRKQQQAQLKDWRNLSDASAADQLLEGLVKGS